MTTIELSPLDQFLGTAFYDGWATEFCSWEESVDDRVDDSAPEELVSALGEISVVLESGVIAEFQSYLALEFSCYHWPDAGTETSWLVDVRDRMATRALDRGLLPESAHADVMRGLAQLGLSGPPNAETDDAAVIAVAKRYGAEASLDEVIALLGAVSLALGMPRCSSDSKQWLTTVRSEIATVAATRWPRTRDRPRTRERGYP